MNPSRDRESNPATDPAPNPRAAPLLISLPHGLDLGGVTTWAVRLANGLAERGRAVAMIAHPRPDGCPAAHIDLHPGVRLIAPADFPPMAHAAGDLSPYLPVYRHVIAELSRDAGDMPVIFSPNILGDSYGIAAAICMTEPESIRVLAWQHSDTAYDTALLKRYEPIIAKFVAIDRRYVGSLAEMLYGRAGDIDAIPHGVPVPAAPPVARRMLRDRPLRLVYTGRVEHLQKRIGALPLLSDELQRRGIDHTLSIIGDGPAGAELDAMIRTRPRVRHIPNISSEEVAAHLCASDAFILASRYEGLCISRIEAMAHGCVPIITTINSGATSGLHDGVNAEFVTATPDDDERTTAASIADAVERFVARDRDAMALAAWEAARRHFSIEKHVDRVADLMEAAAASAPRWWRANWAPAFSSSHTGPGCSASTGPQAAQRMRATLESMGSRPIILHGAGLHTIELAAAIAHSGARIVGCCDDDAGRWGTYFLGWPVIDPRKAGETGAEDVVISSYMHVDAIWARREVYERQGMRVHRIYPDEKQITRTEAPGHTEELCAGTI